MILVHGVGVISLVNYYSLWSGQIALGTIFLNLMPQYLITSKECTEGANIECGSINYEYISHFIFNIDFLRSNRKIKRRQHSKFITKYKDLKKNSMVLKNASCILNNNNKLKLWL